MSPLQSSANREEISADSFSRFGVKANDDDCILENEEDFVFPPAKLH